MKLKRNYLNAGEIAFITTRMLEVETEYERQMVRYGATISLLVDDTEFTEDETYNDIYTIALENGINIDKEVINIDVVDKIVDRELGVAKTVEGILNGVIASIDESMKNIDPKALILELQNLQNK